MKASRITDAQKVLIIKQGEDRKPIAEMLEEGRATILLTSGELTEATAERIVYSAQTAHLFERPEQKAMLAGSTALSLAAQMILFLSTAH